MSVDAITQKPKRHAPLDKPAPVQTTEEQKPRGLLEAFGSYFSASEPHDVESPSAQPSVLQDVPTLFGLKPDTELHDEFYCTSGGSLGRLYVFDSHIGFVDYFGSANSLLLIPLQTIKEVRSPKEMMNFSLEVETDDGRSHRFSTFLSRDSAASCIEFARKTGGVGQNGYIKRSKRESSVDAKALLRKSQRTQGRRPLRMAMALLATGAALFIGAQQAGLQPEAYLGELSSRCQRAFRHLRTEVQRRLPSPTAAPVPSSQAKKMVRA